MTFIKISPYNIWLAIRFLSIRMIYDIKVKVASGNPSSVR